MTNTQLDLNLILPGHPPEADICINKLEKELKRIRGIDKAHIKKENGKALFCLHYNPDLLTLETITHKAKDAGAKVGSRYKHAYLDLANLHCTDCASSIEAVSKRLEGVLNVSANYASEKMEVTFDSQRVTQDRIIREVQSLGYKAKPANEAQSESSEPHGDSHGGKLFGLSKGLALSLLSGAALVIAWVGQSFVGFPFAIALVFYLAAYLAGGYDATQHAVRAALKGRFDIDVLMVVAALGAAALGEWAEGALLLFLFSLGHALEHYAMDRARGAIRALADLTPKTARVERNSQEINIPVSELVIGDRVIVRSGERLAADGEVIEGESSVDQAPITGESLPVGKNLGDKVFSGTINGDGALVIKTTKAPEDSTLSRVIKMVEQAQTSKAPTQRFTERFQRIFSPVILIMTLLVIFLPPLFGMELRESFIRAMTLLVAASPCALALATPSAVLAGIARAARSGVLIKGGVHLETAGTAQAIAVDKTGTLTEGKPRVTDLITFGHDENVLLRLVASAETRSSHPLANAIVKHAETKGLKMVEVDDFEAVKGKGVRATVEGKRLLIGNSKLMDDAATSMPATIQQDKERLESEGKTAMYVALETAVVGLIAVRDEPRATAKDAIKQLKALGVKHIAMLTGDNRLVAEAIGRDLGVDEVKAELLPEDKVTAIKDLQSRFENVVMLGDGVNDAPAMVEASVGIAMGGAGTDVALETADIALMADDLSKLPFAIALSRASRRMIVQNLIVSLAVIALLVPSALFGLATIGIAIIFHEGSTLVVVLNALRLLGFKVSTK